MLVYLSGYINASPFHIHLIRQGIKTKISLLSLLLKITSWWWSIISMLSHPCHSLLIKKGSMPPLLLQSPKPSPPRFFFACTPKFIVVPFLPVSRPIPSRCDLPGTGEGRWQCGKVVSGTGEGTWREGGGEAAILWRRSGDAGEGSVGSDNARERGIKHHFLAAPPSRVHRNVSPSS